MWKRYPQGSERACFLLVYMGVRARNTSSDINLPLLPSWCSACIVYTQLRDSFVDLVSANIFLIVYSLPESSKNERLHLCQWKRKGCHEKFEFQRYPLEFCRYSSLRARWKFQMLGKPRKNKIIMGPMLGQDRSQKNLCRYSSSERRESESSIDIIDLQNQRVRHKFWTVRDEFWTECARKRLRPIPGSPCVSQWPVICGESWLGVCNQNE